MMTTTTGQEAFVRSFAVAVTAAAALIRQSELAPARGPAQLVVEKKKTTKLDVNAPPPPPLRRRRTL